MIHLYTYSPHSHLSATSLIRFKRGKDPCLCLIWWLIFPTNATPPSPAPSSSSSCSLLHVVSTPASIASASSLTTMSLMLHPSFLTFCAVSFCRQCPGTAYKARPPPSMHLSISQLLLPCFAGQRWRRSQHQHQHQHYCLLPPRDLDCKCSGHFSPR